MSAELLIVCAISDSLAGDLLGDQLHVISRRRETLRVRSGLLAILRRGHDLQVRIVILEKTSDIDAEGIGEAHRDLRLRRERQLHGRVDIHGAIGLGNDLRHHREDVVVDLIRGRRRGAIVKPRRSAPCLVAGVRAEER